MVSRKLLRHGYNLITPGNKYNAIHIIPISFLKDDKTQNSSKEI